MTSSKSKVCLLKYFTQQTFKKHTDLFLSFLSAITPEKTTIRWHYMEDPPKNSRNLQEKIRLKIALKNIIGAVIRKLIPYSNNMNHVILLSPVIFLNERGKRGLIYIR